MCEEGLAGFQCLYELETNIGAWENPPRFQVMHKLFSRLYVFLRKILRECL